MRRREQKRGVPACRLLHVMQMATVPIRRTETGRVPRRSHPRSMADVPVRLQSTRSTPPQPARARYILGGALLGVAIWQVLRTVVRGLRVPLRSDWTMVSGLQRSTSLAVHARVSDDVVSSIPPIVLVHGFGMGSSYFIPLAAQLRDGAQVYAPDLPGHGPSDHDVRPRNPRELADALMAWMDARSVSGALIVAHSMGGQIATEVAVRRPDLVAGLVLISPAADPEARTVAGQIVRAIRSALFERPGLAIWVVLDFARAGTRVLRAELRELVAYRLEDALPKVTAPVRVVRGKWDQLVPQAWAETVARLAGAPAPIVIERWSHTAHYDDPEAVAAVVLQLAGEVVRTQASRPSSRPRARHWSAQA